MSGNLSSTAIRCLDCGAEAPFHPLAYRCPNCASEWREAVYAYDRVRASLPRDLPQQPFDLWRYGALLPAHRKPSIPHMGEGGTPLLRAQTLGRVLGLQNLFIKDERRGPTASFKDRQAAVTLAALTAAGLREAVVASTGNVAIAFSAYCARAGVRLTAFITSLVPPEKMHEIAIYGTRVIKVSGTYDQAKSLAVEYARRNDVYIDRGVQSIAAVESMKTIAYEIAEQLGALLGADEDSPEPAWRSPDWYLQAVSGGIGPIGVLKGFSELLMMGFIERLPALGCVQTAGCAPMVSAWENGLDTATPVPMPSTRIATLTTGDPGRAYTLLKHRMHAASGGEMLAVTDEAAFQSMHMLAQLEGISAEPAAAVAVAGLMKLIESGHIQPSHVVVVNISGHTLPVEKKLLGDGWSLDLELPQMAMAPVPQEGLLSALSALDQSHVDRILIIDDEPDARRLVQRVLQIHGSFHFQEAASGFEGLLLAQASPPDLIILDLMMPEMDGYEVLERLKLHERTASIPVIILTAKDLTESEKRRIRDRVVHLSVKGDVPDEAFLEEIRRALD